MRKQTVALAVALAFTAGCFGSFNLTRKLWTWNDHVDQSKWIKWLVFLALSIVPVYEIAAFADALVLNSVEFWTGANPVTLKETSDGTRMVMSDGHLRIERKGKVVDVEFGDGGAVARDESGNVLSRVTAREDGSVAVADGAGRELFTRGPAQLQQLEAAVEGGAPFLATFDAQDLGLRVANAR